MVKVKWKLDRGNVYLGLKVLTVTDYYKFPKKGCHKRFHPRQIFIRPIHHKAYKDSLIPHYVKGNDWIEGELEDRLVKEKLGIPALTWEEFYEQLSKVC